MSDWISVKDRLPEFGQSVLVLYKNVVQKVSWKRDILENNNWRWVTSLNVPGDNEADRDAFKDWMPLPKPPNHTN